MKMLLYRFALVASGVGVITFLAGCASAPDAKTAEGCGISGYSAEKLKANTRRVSWSGGCSDGLANGNGKFEIEFNTGSRFKFVGNMKDGWPNDGELTNEHGWRFVGGFLYRDFTNGKVYNAGNVLVFDGVMAHNVKDPTGKNVEYKDQRYDRGTLYFVGSNERIEDGRFDGSTGLYPGSRVVIPNTGQGLIWGRYYRGDELVYRLADGKLHDNDTSYLQARSAVTNREIAAMQRANEAFYAAEREKNARETREALGQLALILANTTGSRGGVSSSGTGGQAPAAPARPQTNSPSPMGGSASKQSAAPELTSEEFHRRQQCDTWVKANPTRGASPEFTPPACEDPPPNSGSAKGRLGNQECIDKASNIQREWSADAIRAGSNQAAIQAAERRAQIALRNLFQASCASHPQADVWVAKATEALNKPAGNYGSGAPSAGGDSSRDYPPIPNCLSLQRTDPKKSNFMFCVRNVCGRTLEANFSGGMASVRAHSCQIVSGGAGTVLFAACEKDNVFYRDKGLCRR